MLVICIVVIHRKSKLIALTQSLFTYHSTAYVHKNDQLSAHLMHFNNDGILRHITIKENPINLSTMTKDIIRLYNSNLNIPNFVRLTII